MTRLNSNWICWCLLPCLLMGITHGLANDVQNQFVNAIVIEEDEDGADDSNDGIAVEEEMDDESAESEEAVVVIEVAQVVIAAPAAAPAQAAPQSAKPAAHPGTPAAGQPQANAAATNVVVLNIEDKEFKAPTIELQDGKVNVKSDPAQVVSMDELQKISFNHTTNLVVTWIGQANRDLVQVGAVEEGNGIRDLHIRAAGLCNKKLTQVAIIARPQFRVWKKDVSKSLFWKVAVERIGEASVADFYFEPPTQDLFETELEVTVTFDDQTNATSKIKVPDHTSDQVAVDSDAPALPRLANVQLDGGDKLKGFVQAGAADQCVIETGWNSAFGIPLSQLRGILFDGVKPEVTKKYEEILAKPGENDFIMVVSKDGGFAEINGQIQLIGTAGVKVLYEGQERTVKLDRVQAIVRAAAPSARDWKGPFQIFKLASGDLVSAYWQTYDDKAFKLKTAWDQELDVSKEAVVEITGRNTKMVNLSELNPVTVEQVSYFDRLIPWVRDKAWNNKPLKMNERTYQRGLAMHSRCVLTFDLGGEFTTFRAVLGFEDDIGDRGRVICRVAADEQELFAKNDLRATEKPVPVEVSVKGAKQLRLEVDFGEDEDVGDRVIWANARLYR